MKMDRPAPPRVEPFVECLGKCRTIALMNLRQPDEDVGSVEERPEGLEFFPVIGVRVFSQNHAGNMGARSSDNALKGRHQLCEIARVELQQNLLARPQLQRIRYSPRALFIIGDVQNDPLWLQPMLERWIVPARCR